MILVALNSELRAKAREQLKGKWKTPVLAVLVYGVIAMGMSAVPLIGPLASLVLTAPLMLGLIIFFLKFSNGEPVEVSNLFDGFTYFGPALGLYYWMGLWIFLWSLLLFIPGIIKSISYSMSFYIMADNPQIGAKEALNISKRITTGFKGKIFMLGLSFIGWSLLACLTLGIGFLWLVPYAQLSFVNLYKELKAEAEANGNYHA